MSELGGTTFPIHRLALENTEYRRVLKTGGNLQVVLMAIPEGEEIGAEAHEGHDQVLVFVEGDGKAVIGGTESPVTAGDLSFVSSGTHHNFINTGKGFLKLYTFYAPPEHPAGTLHQDKGEADAAEHAH